MSDACIIAAFGVSAFGTGPAAYDPGGAGERARVAIARDGELAAAGLTRPFVARAPAPVGGANDDRATSLLRAALLGAIDALTAVRPAFRAERVGVALGTSSGGMLSAERLFAARAAGASIAGLARPATYFAPFDDALEAAGLCATRGPRTHVLAACAASTFALGVALRWLDRGACDVVLAGGYDAVSVFVAAGFEALRATTASKPRPFGLARDGMALGEGAGVVALVRESGAPRAAVLGRIAGFGAATDAVHITAPDREGRGLAAAARRALEDASIDAARVGLVSAHATATPFNDAMEARAIAAALGSGPPPVVHPFKAQIGHTLGAAGVLETLAAARALATEVAPAAAIPEALDPDAPALLLARGERRSIDAALKLSAAFGGANAALVLTRAPSGRRPREIRAARLRAFAHVTSADLAALAEATGAPRDRLARLDALCRLGLTAVAALAAQVGRDALSGAGIVAGHAFATLDTNERFDARKRSRGPTLVEPRLFPATSPNALAGECAIVYGLTGPSFAVSSGLDGGTEALARAAELVASGDADRVVVVAADDAGPVARDLLQTGAFGERVLEAGAASALVWAGDSGPLIPLDLPVDHAAPLTGHLGLLRHLSGM